MTQTLWRHADFLKLWSAQAISAFGSRITREGLPMAAVLTLEAKPAELGILAALAYGPGAFIGLFAGGWADRQRRRPILIGTDVLRVLLILTVPLAAWTGLLSMPQLYVVAALVGASGVVFAIADHAYLPSLIPKDRLLEGNSKLGVTESVAEIGGPALAGLLFQVLTAPIAMLVNAGTYLVSGVLLAFIRQPEPPPEPTAKPRHVLEDLQTGLLAVWREPLIRPLLLMTVVQTLFSSFFASLYILFAIETLRFTPGVLGFVIAVGGIGALAGALLAQWSVKRLGLGPAIILTGLISAGSAVLVPLAPTTLAFGIACMVGAQLLGDAFAVAAMIPAGTLRQSVFSRSLLGRTAAVFHVARGTMSMAGALIGGVLGQTIGVREALWVSVIGIVLGGLIPLASPLWKLRELPEA